MNRVEHGVPIEILSDPIGNRDAIDRAFRRGVRAALLEHKQAGNPVAVWQNGQVVWIAPEDIVLPPDPDEERPAAAPDEEAA
jgi:hypothetical protein